jgi:hypothetical protein
MAGLLAMFSPGKIKPNEQDEVITITLPLKWSKQGLKDKVGLIFPVPEIPIDQVGQIEFNCLIAKMAYTPGKCQTLVKAMNGTNHLADDYKSLPQVCFQKNESENVKTENVTKSFEYERPTITSTVRHIFVQEPELLTQNSVYITHYNKRAAEVLLTKWTNDYAGGVAFHRLKFKDFKIALDRAYRDPRDPLRFDLWDCITNLYLYRNRSKLTQGKEVCIQGRRDEITKRHNIGNKIRTNVRPSPPKRTRNQR